MVAACAVPGLASAGPATPPAADDGRAWLARIHDAASERNYQGTMAFSAGGAVSSSRIAHYCEGRQSFERVEVLDGQARQVLRHNDLVQTMWPAQRLALVEHRDPLTPFPGLLQPGGNEQLLDRYELKAEGTDRVAGYDSVVLLLKPRDGDRYAQRLWAERDSGLLLRTDVLAPDGHVLESSAFTELKIGVKPQPDAVLQPMRKLDGWRVVKPPLVRTRLGGEGWSLSPPVAGFREISCVKRPLDAPSEAAGVSGTEVLQSIYSDGLTNVSVFIEPYNAARHKPVMMSIGATHTLMNKRDDWWVTVVGDVPMATLKQFYGALERRP